MFLLHYLAEFFFPKKKNFIILELFDYPEIQFVQEGQDKYFFPCNLKSFFFFFFAEVGFELRALHLLGRHSTA
jgi:hypothetical protein